MKDSRYWFLMDGPEVAELVKKTAECAKKNDKKSVQMKKMIEKSVQASIVLNKSRKLDEDDDIPSYEYKGKTYNNVTSCPDENGVDHIFIGNGSPTPSDGRFWPSLDDQKAWGTEVSKDDPLYATIARKLGIGVKSSEKDDVIKTLEDAAQAVAKADDVSKLDDKTLQDAYVKVMMDAKKKMSQEQKEVLDQQDESLRKIRGDLNALHRNGMLDDEDAKELNGVICKAVLTKASDPASVVQVRKEVIKDLQDGISQIKTNIENNIGEDTVKGQLMSNLLGVEFDEYGGDYGPGFGLADALLSLGGAASVASIPLKTAAKEGVKEISKQTVKKALATVVKNEVVGATVGYVVGKGVEAAASKDDDSKPEEKPEEKPAAPTPAEIDKTAEFIHEASKGASDISSAAKGIAIGIGALAALVFGFFAVKKLWKKSNSSQKKQVGKKLSIAKMQFKDDNREDNSLEFQLDDKMWHLYKNGKEVSEEEAQEALSSEEGEKFQKACVKKLENMKKNMKVYKAAANINDDKELQECFKIVDEDYDEILENMAA